MQFADLKNTLADWLAATSTVAFPESMRGTAINFAVRTLLRKRDIRFGEATVTVQATANVPSSDLPDNFSYPFSLYYLNSQGNRVTLNYLNKEEFDFKYPPGTAAGEILDFTIWGNKFWWGPIPNNNQTIQVNGYFLLPDLVNPTDENIVTKEAWEVVLARAAWFACKYLLRNGQEASWRALADELETDLVIEHARARTSGRRAESREFGRRL